MGQTEFTGRLQEVVHGTYTIESLTKVALTETDGPDAQQIDVTVKGDTTYTKISDPLGSQGQDKTSLVCSCWASTASYADSKNSKIPLNTAASTTYDMAKGTANANTLTHTTLQLTKRVTTIQWREFATQELTFEANALGTWDSPA
jgi:hypothetical protein